MELCLVFLNYPHAHWMWLPCRLMTKVNGKRKVQLADCPLKRIVRVTQPFPPIDQSFDCV